VSAGGGAGVGAGADVGIIIVAAGQGTRAGGQELKQFRWIRGKPMLLHSVQRFQARSDVAMVVCVLPREYAGDPPPWLFQADHDRLLLSVGGRERADSVRNGLQDLSDECSIVLVHDAARPFVPDDMVERVIASARAGKATVPVLPVVDTLKECADDGTVVRTAERERFRRVQTPQAFPRGVLERAYRQAPAGVAFTDDASLVEHLGIAVHTVPGDERAMKITTADDFARAEALMLAST